jgi:hypothetical protein
VLPYTENAPTQAFKFPADYSIPQLVSIKFAHPKRLVANRKTTVNRAAVPKTTIYKYGETGGRKDEVRLAKNFCAAAPSSNPKLSKDAD